ncbi:hypothetical protein KIL84_022710 [Mauremys mutica]|uniref:Uncharacterized protein n=1 Tax=Mauremys mutica TaxID=74926 RepID=A0A9D4AQV6_9SAUR|nr:hypothetical protein KIL84_022710 [Mauremys mutica]
MVQHCLRTLFVLDLISEVQYHQILKNSVEFFILVAMLWLRRLLVFDPLITCTQNVKLSSCPKSQFSANACEALIKDSRDSPVVEFCGENVPFYKPHFSEAQASPGLW